ncbi:MAG: hypothetical protein ABW019_03690 [Chitinophagaceae bacterium]
MKIEMIVTLTKESDILCDIFRFRIEYFLRYYMKQVSLGGITDKTKPDDINCATLFFILCAA